jgi:hypothetical protein
MPADIQNIKIGVNLIDDYLLTQEAPVANGLTRDLFTVVQNPASENPVSELLTIDGDGYPVHFYPDSTSQSGWTTVKLGATKPKNTGAWNRIVGFYHQGVLNALCYYPHVDATGTSGSSAVWRQSSEPGTWTAAKLSSSAQNWLGYTFQTDQYVDADGNGYLYGITGNVSPHSFFVMTYVTVEDSGQLSSRWQPIAEMYPTMFSPAISDPDTAAFRLTQGPGSTGSITLLWVDDNNISHQDGTITWTEQNGGKTASLALTGTSSTFSPNVGTLTADNLFGIPGDLGSGHLLIVDGTSKLYLVSNLYASNPTMTALTGTSGQPGSATAVAVGVDASNTVTIFAIEPGSNYLWYLQQSSTSSLSFGTWVQLGGTLYALNCPAYMRAGPELFSAGLGTDPQSGGGAPAVYHTGQNLSDAGDGTYIWTTHKVSAPPAPSNTTPVRTATYSMELQGYDSGQNPVGNGTVTVTADQPLTVIWNGFAYHIGPSTPLEVQLDASAQATVFYEAVGLKPPVVTFTAYDTNSAVTGSRWCRGDVVEFIQSLDGTPLPTLSDSVAPQMQSVTGADLINNGLTGGDYSNSGPANTAAQAINATGQYMVQNAQDTSGQGAIDTSRVKIPHWQIDFSHPDGPRFRVLSDEEARDFLAGLPRPGDVEALGSFGSVFGDVAHFFKHEFDQLEKFTATMENGVLSIVFNDLAPFAIATIKQAGAGLETIFAKIKQIADEIYTVIQEVIAWLKMLFDWDDILNTHTAIKYVINQTLFTNMETAITDAETDLSKWFSSLNADITSAFEDLESHFDSSTSFNDMANGAQSAAPILAAASGNALAGTTTQNTQQQHASKCNYVQSRSTASLGNVGSSAIAALATDPQGSDPTQSIIQAIQTNIMGQQYNQGSQNLLNVINETVANPSGFFDFVVLTFLEAAQDLTLFVVGVLEAVLEAILELVEDALSGLNTMLNASIEIPVITWLWQHVITDGDPFTILDLFCLTLAVPTTILYKILFGGSNASPPFTSSTLNELTTNGLPWPTIPTVSDAGVTWSTPLGYTPPSKDVTMPLGIIAGLSYFVSGCAEADSDYYAATDQADEATAVSIFTIILSAYQNGATAPYAIFAKPWADWTDAERWTLSSWFSGNFQLCCDTAFVALSSTHTLTKFVDGVGPVGDTAMGICEEAVGVVACIYQSKSDSGYTPWDCSASVIAPIDEGLKFLLDCGDDAVIFLQGCDIVLGIGTMVTVCGAARNG